MDLQYFLINKIASACLHELSTCRYLECVPRGRGRMYKWRLWRMRLCVRTWQKKKTKSIKSTTISSTDQELSGEEVGLIGTLHQFKKKKFICSNEGGWRMRLIKKQKNVQRAHNDWRSAFRGKKAIRTRTSSLSGIFSVSNEWLCTNPNTHTRATQKKQKLIYTR